MIVSPPFRSWIWSIFWLAIIWSVLFFLTYLFLDKEDTSYRKILYSSIENNNKAIKTDPDQCSHLVILGDSLIGRSIPNASILKKKLPDNIFCKVSIYWISGGTVDKFIQSGLIDRLYALSDIKNITLIVQDNILLTKRKKTFISKIKIALRYFILFNDYTNKKWQEKSHQKQVIITRKITKKTISIKSKHWLDIYEINPFSSKKSKEFIDKMTHKVRKIILVNLPRSSVIEGNLNKKREKWFSYLNKEFLELELITIGYPLPDNHYSDGAHPNERGSNVRVEQFVKLITDTIK